MVNALLIASRGIPMERECTTSTNGRPFARNLRIPGFFTGVCANCKWNGTSGRCSLGNIIERQYLSIDKGPVPQPSIVERLID